MLVNKKTIRYILYTFPIFLLLIFPLVMGCVVYAINLNSKQLDTTKNLIYYINDFLPFNATISPSSEYLDYNYFQEYVFTNFSQANDEFIWYEDLDSEHLDYYKYEFHLPSSAKFYFDNESNNYVPIDYDNIYLDFLSEIFNIVASKNLVNLSDFMQYWGFNVENQYTTELTSVLYDYLQLVGFLDEPISLNNTPQGSILSDLYLNLFNGLVVSFDLYGNKNLGLPDMIFNYSFYALGVFLIYIIFIVMIYIPKLCITLLDKHLDKISGGSK